MNESLFSVFKSSIFHPFSATTVLRIIKTAAEQVVPAIAATNPYAPGISGIPGTNPFAMALKSGFIMKKTTINETPIRITKKVSTFSNA
ncbi:hypothetical protein SDC9_211038 [bioreactor metagenome]|uniref:Uncharacterized protein n=1 Tax=bioreactor metagenome TaxID=1076179 RepID=A0A645JI28_9ZZZZ